MSDKAKFQCRMYEARYPEVEDVVMVNVRQIAEMGAYVKLLEYDNIEGMILLSELSRRRIRSIQKIIRVNRNEVVVVLRVDKEKGYIDLSKRRVTPEDIAKCEDKYNKSKSVHLIMRRLAEKRNMALQDLYQQIGWPLYKKYGHAFDAFKLMINNSEKVLEELDIEQDLRDELIAIVERHLTPQRVKIRADVEVTCFTYKGIDAIKEALMQGESRSTEETPVKVRLVAPPLYVMTTHTYDKQEGIELLEQAIADIEKNITANGGALAVKMKPKAVSESDDAALSALMEQAERENAEVSGDSDIEEDDAEA
ncbi:hypothetical protein RI367_002316 [Sorochytrium milnesiophthora]